MSNTERWGYRLIVSAEVVAIIAGIATLLKLLGVALFGEVAHLFDSLCCTLVLAASLFGYRRVLNRGAGHEEKK